jgi:SAM-dependent methyltransferase
VPRKTFLQRLRNAPTQIRLLVRRTLRTAVGLPTSLDTEDRRLLERDILPWFAGQDRIQRILFVGCDWYTRHYERVFAHRDYWTMESLADRRRYGARQHVTDSVTNVKAHFPDRHFDLILFNGVLGWGLHDVNDAHAALRALPDLLAPGGLLLVGWNDTAERRVLDPEELPLVTRWTFPPWGVSRRALPDAGRHVFDFYIRP